MLGGWGAVLEYQAREGTFLQKNSFQGMAI